MGIVFVGFCYVDVCLSEHNLEKRGKEGNTPVKGGRQTQTQVQYAVALLGLGNANLSAVAQKAKYYARVR